MTLLYLVRHGETDWNLARRIQGKTDVPLNDTGREQARRTGRLLSRRQWDRVVSSPLVRAAETADIIAAELGLGEVERILDIAERNYGEAEGLTTEELAERFPGRAEVPGREGREVVAARVLAALARLGEQHPGERIIVTSHGGVIRAVLNIVAPDEPSHRGIPISNGSVHTFEYTDGGLRLVQFDDRLEHESVDSGAGDIDQQNAVEAQGS